MRVCVTTAVIGMICTIIVAQAVALLAAQTAPWKWEATLVEKKATAWPRMVPNHWPSTPPVDGKWNQRIILRPGHAVSAYTYSDRTGLYTYQIWMYGFPFPAIMKDIAHDITYTTMLPGSKLSRFPYSGFPLPRSGFRIPLIPWIPGLLADAITWSLLVLAIRSALDKLRSRRRLKKKRCISCGYSLANIPSTVCPECGTVSPAKQ